MTLSDQFQATYDELLAHLGQHCDAMPSDVCMHWPMHQPSYAGRLLVIGQALNGWMVEAPTCELVDVRTRTAMLAEARTRSEGPTSFKWMRREVWGRPFWRLARVAMDALGQTLEDIAWSNLAKIAPAAGRNPSRELLWRQHQLGGELLRQEVEELDPDLVLVISGRGYAEPFIAAAGFAPDWERRGALQFDGTLGRRRWIVVSHPGTFAYRYEASRVALEGALGSRRST